MSARGEDLRHPFFSPDKRHLQAAWGESVLSWPASWTVISVLCVSQVAQRAQSLLCLKAGRPGLQDGRRQLYRQELQFKHQFNVMVDGDYA